MPAKWHIFVVSLLPILIMRLNSHLEIRLCIGLHMTNAAQSAITDIDDEVCIVASRSRESFVSMYAKTKHFQHERKIVRETVAVDSVHVCVKCMMIFWLTLFYRRSPFTERLSH